MFYTCNKIRSERGREQIFSMWKNNLHEKECEMVIRVLINLRQRTPVSRSLPWTDANRNPTLSREGRKRAEGWKGDGSIIWR